MRKYIIHGGRKLAGEINISGAKNVVLKALVAACLTREEVEIKNVPLIGDFYSMLDLVTYVGGKVDLRDHTVKIKVDRVNKKRIPLELGAKIRTSSMFLAPLLLRKREALIPNPGGCRIGARPIDRHIKGLEKMGVRIHYRRSDGYFHARVEQRLVGCEYTFEKNTHTGTETMILASVLAKGRTVLKNAAEEPEVDDLINFLNLMGAKIRRENDRTVVVDGVRSLRGTSFSVSPDRNEAVTFAIASVLTGGGIYLKSVDLPHIETFLERLREAGGSWEKKDSYVRFFVKEKIRPINVVTAPYPGFMTDWQGPWAVLMTQVSGVSTIHETVYEDRFGYVEELARMGAHMLLFNPKVNDPEHFYNFNYTKSSKRYKHAVKIFGRTSFHNAVLRISDLRAGATLILAALIAKGESVIYGVEHLERGYEDFVKRLKSLGADIKVVEE